MKTADEYFDEVPEKRRDTLMAIRKTIKSLVPEVTESMEYRMPTYAVDNKVLFALANQKNYLALYVIPFDLLESLEQDINIFSHGKSCIRFTGLTGEKRQVIEKVIRHVADTHSKSIYYGRYLSK